MVTLEALGMDVSLNFLNECDSAFSIMFTITAGGSVYVPVWLRLSLTITFACRNSGRLVSSLSLSAYGQDVMHRLEVAALKITVRAKKFTFHSCDVTSQRVLHITRSSKRSTAKLAN